MSLRTFGTGLARALDIRATVRSLAVIATVVVVLGLAEDAGAPLAPFDLDRDFALPSLLTGLLLLAPAALALLLSATGPRLPWAMTAAAFTVLAVDELLYAHQRIEARTDLTWTTAFLPVVVVTGVVWLACTRWITQTAPRAIVLGAAALWLISQALEGALDDRGALVAVVKPVLDLAAAGALTVGLLLELRARLGTTAGQNPLSVVDAFLRGARPARAAAAVALLIAVLALAGSLVGAGTLEAYFLDLNGEQTLPAAFSGGLLFVAAALAYLLHDAWPSDAHGGRWWLLLAGVFAFLGVDEIGALHEKIQDATDIHPGQIVLLPLVVAAGLAWVVALRRMPSATGRNLWLAGAALWVLSQAVDATQPPNRFVWSVVPEEVLEMAGSALFALALLAALRDRPGLTASR